MIVKNRLTNEVVFDGDVANLSSADLMYANLSSADLRNADLMYANLSSANLSSADLRDADLRNANLRDANLSSADLRNANLRDADLMCADLSNANLRGADLRDAYLSSANLSGADLSSANLSSADLMYADLSSADLRNANLTDTHLDPNNEPQCPASDFHEQDDEFVFGYRTELSSMFDKYRVGRVYAADYFSTDAETECHPGLYLFPTIEQVYAFKEGKIPVVKVKTRLRDVQKMKYKYRCRWFEVVERIEQ